MSIQGSDAAFATLTGNPTVSEKDISLTYTAALDKAITGETLVTLSCGPTLTIPADTINASVPVGASWMDDVYMSSAAVTCSITAIANSE